MGDYLKQNDIYVDNLQAQLNLRFAPTADSKAHYGGLDEMVALQKEFEIFKKGRRFASSVAALNLAGLANHEVKNQFHAYLGSLHRVRSSRVGASGDAAIVDALVSNLAARKPLPVYFALHDRRADKNANRVHITERARPLFYMDHDYLVISLPIGATGPSVFP